MKKTKVSGDEVDAAFTAWLEAHGIYHDEDFEGPPWNFYSTLRKEFHQLSETRSFCKNFKPIDTYRVSPEAAARIRAMCGVHGYAYCKAIMANREEVS